MTILPNSPEFVGAATLTWQQHMKSAVRTPEELAHRLDLPLESICADQSKGAFPLFVPLPYLSRIEAGNPNDPLLAQVLPSFQENDDNQIDTGSKDPVGESQFIAGPGLIQKYRGRALMVVNGVCAIHCRYCFRRHFPYDSQSSSKPQWAETLAPIASDPSIKEIILSGGDPLTLTDDALAGLVSQIEGIDHVERVRFHTRLPVVIPQRVTNELVQRLATSRLSSVFVLHCNHANEIDSHVRHSVEKLSVATKAVLNQAVLLRGVNDDVESLIALSHRLIDAKIVPYYLHHFDPVQGAMHFEVPVEEGRKLVDLVRAQLSGYMVPRYVQEVPGEPYKSLLI